MTRLISFLILASFASSGQTVGMFNSSQGSVTWAASTTYYYWQDAAPSTTSTPQNRITLPVACVAKNLYFEYEWTQSGTGAFTITLYDVTGAAATALTATIPAGTTAGVVSDTTHTVILYSGRKYSLRLQNAATASVAGRFNYSFQCN